MTALGLARYVVDNHKLPDEKHSRRVVRNAIVILKADCERATTDVAELETRTNDKRWSVWSKDLDKSWQGNDYSIREMLIRNAKERVEDHPQAIEILTDVLGRM